MFTRSEQFTILIRWMCLRMRLKNICNLFVNNIFKKILFKIRLNLNCAKVRISQKQFYYTLLLEVRRLNARKIHSSFKLERYRKLNFIRPTRRGIQENRIEMREKRKLGKLTTSVRFAEHFCVTVHSRNYFRSMWLVSADLPLRCLIDNVFAKFFVLLFIV